MLKSLLYILLTIAISSSMAQFPVIQQGDIAAGDNRLTKEIGISKTGELTTASFNIRNLGARQRSLRDFAVLADLVDESDIVLIQEAGLGVYWGTEIKEKHKNRMDGVVALFSINLGEEWRVIMAPGPSGVINGTETTILAFRKQAKGFTIRAIWQEYVDLGEFRDMAVFKVTTSANGNIKDLILASVHLTPKDPERGAQMIKVSDWLISQGQKQAVVMGDFNWGYEKKSGVINYLGEEKIRSRHQGNQQFQLFFNLSYLGKANSHQLRTNMNFRKDGYFYDQFIMTPVVAGLLADGGVLQKDCGIFAFDLRSREMRDTINYWTKKRKYGLDHYLTNANLTKDSNRTAYDKTLKGVVNQGANDATFILSDHRIIWMQLKIWP